MGMEAYKLHIMINEATEFERDKIFDLVGGSEA